MRKIPARTAGKSKPVVRSRPRSPGHRARAEDVPPRESMVIAPKSDIPYSPGRICSPRELRVEDRLRELLALIAAQDIGAFEVLYASLVAPMHSLAFRILGTRPEAEDVLQMGFHLVWLRASSYHTLLGSPSAWVATIIRRKAIDVLRVRGRHRQRTDNWEQCIDDRGLPPADELLLRNEKLMRVRNALSDLEPEERCTIELSFFEELTHCEIARVLQTPVGTVKARIRRGMIKLRPRLSECMSSFRR